MVRKSRKLKGLVRRRQNTRVNNVGERLVRERPSTICVKDTGADEQETEEVACSAEVVEAADERGQGEPAVVGGRGGCRDVGQGLVDVDLLREGCVTNPA